MKRTWSSDELIAHFTLLPDETALLGNKTGATRLGFAILLKAFQLESRFPRYKNDVPRVVVDYVARQLRLSPDLYLEYDWQGRSTTYHRGQIREALGFRAGTLDDATAMTAWLVQSVVAHDHDLEHLKLRVYARFAALKIEPLSSDQIERVIRSALHTYADQLSTTTHAKLSAETCQKLDALLRPGAPPPLEASSVAAVNARTPDTTETPPDSDAESETAPQTPAVPYFQTLKSDPGRIGLDSILTEAAKLQNIRALGLPADLFSHIPPNVLRTYHKQALTDTARELRRHPEARRYTLVAAFCWLRQQAITDSLVELLLGIVHRIGAKAERTVTKQLLTDLRQVTGKETILFDIAQASLGNPDGAVKDVVFPVVSEQTLHDVVREYKASGPGYRQSVYTKMRASYRSHYRKMLPQIVTVLDFRSNNTAHRPVIRGLALLKKYADSATHYYPDDEDVPLTGVLRAGWRDIVVEKDEETGSVRISRINYEIAVLQALRDALRCKEIWVVGANRYRNPDDDLPGDFDDERQTYYAALKQPLEAQTFVTELQKSMIAALTALDTGMPKNTKVKLSSRKGGWIGLTPLDALPDPPNLERLKAEIGRRWGLTGLLDILKETDLRINFTDLFKSSAARDGGLDRTTLQRRLLLCLYAIGTNTGLKRVCAGDHGENLSELVYVKRRFIDRDQLRAAIIHVANAIFAARQTAIWGEATTSCASDSKKFGSWDQNLMTEWHARYGGRGIMIYWHVEKKSTCIYSQLKSCSSSEVAAMIEGVLRHCTTMSVDKNYVDTHGQSEVAFAFCYLLGFQLMPRFKNIHSQKLYRPETGKPDAYPNLQHILTRPINWTLIRQQYDQMVKFATALRLGLAETEAILRRFTRNNLSHPTYQALAELGKAVKTIFLCRYLQSEGLRHEVEDGLNVVENWNSANSFIFYGKKSEFASNDLASQELSMLALHLLQNCMVYVNTLMIQRVLAEKAWLDPMKADDFRALTPLIYAHINPYGQFSLNFEQRLALDTQEVA